MNEIALKPTYWASVSGGKDSLYMFYYIMNHQDKYPINGAVHFELEIDYPFIKNVVDYMESECIRKGIPFYRIKPDVKWLDCYEKWGYPSRVNRWCNNKYKLNAKEKFTRILKEKGCKPIWYIGLCADETKRFKVELNDICAGVRYPLAEAGIIEAKILQWAQQQPIFNNFYKFNKRCGCIGCPLTSLINSAYDAVFYPDAYNSYMKMASDTEKKIAQKSSREKFSVWQTQGKYDTEYRDKVVKGKYIPKILKKMEELKHD